MPCEANCSDWSTTRNWVPEVYVVWINSRVFFKCRFQANALYSLSGALVYCQRTLLVRFWKCEYSRALARNATNRWISVERGHPMKQTAMETSTHYNTHFRFFFFFYDMRITNQIRIIYTYTHTNLARFNGQKNSINLLLMLKSSAAKLNYIFYFIANRFLCFKYLYRHRWWTVLSEELVDISKPRFRLELRLRHRQTV